MKHYTKEEDEIILKHVNENMLNLSVAFNLAAKELDKSPAGVSYRYYRKLRYSSNISLVSLSNKTGSINSRKNNPRKDGVLKESMSSQVKPLKVLLLQFLSLGDEEKEKFCEFIDLLK